MFNIVGLNEEERKTIYKLCELKDYKKIFKAAKITDKTLLVKTKKTMSSIKVEDINNYFEKHYFDLDDKFYNLVVNLMYIKVKEKYPDCRKIEDIVNDRKVSEITEEDKDKFKEFEQSYPLDVFKISFDRFVMFCTVPTDEEIESIKNNKKEKKPEVKVEIINDESKKKIDSLKERIDKQKDEIAELKKKLNEKTEELNKIKKEKQDLLNKISISNVTKKFDSLLPIGYKYNSAKELYEKLVEIEKSAVDKNDTAKLKDILAAKYAIVEIEEEE